MRNRYFRYMLAVVMAAVVLAGCGASSGNIPDGTAEHIEQTTAPDDDTAVTGEITQAPVDAENDTAPDEAALPENDTATDEAALPESDTATDEAALPESDTAPDEVTPPETAASAIPAGTGKPVTFTTHSLAGQEVTDDIFSDYDLTIVHIWGTYCGPCLSEMGDYADAYSGLPDNVNLMAVVCDVYEDDPDMASYAQRILDDSGAKFLNVCLSEDLAYLIYNIQYVPSSFFVDSQGRLIGEMMDGASFDMTMDQLDRILNRQ